MPAIDRFLDRCEILFRNAANLALLIILGVSALNMGSRALLGQGVVWAFPVILAFFIWMTFLGFYPIYRTNKDIAVYFFVMRMPEWIRRAVWMFVNLSALVLLFVILREAPDLLRRQVGNLEMIGIQRYWLSVPFFASCALIALHYANDLLHALRGGPEPDYNPAGEI